MNDLVQSAAAQLENALPWEAEPLAAVGDAAGRPVFVSDPARAPSLTASGVHMTSFFGGRFAPGDAAVSNDPFVGASHVTDFTLVRRCERGTAFVRMRLPDIGGFEFGGLAPQSFDTWGEGARFPALLVAVRGEPRSEGLDLVALNSRTPKLIRRGVAAMEEVAGRLAHAIDTGAGPDDEPLRSAAAAAASALTGLRPGEYAAEAQVDSPLAGDSPVVRVALEVGDTRPRLSFAGSSAQIEAPLNSPPAHTLDCCLSALATAVPGFPLAPGALDALEIDTGAGTITGAEPPAITGLAPYHTAHAIHRALATALRAAGVPTAVDLDDWWETAGSAAYERRVDPATLRLRGERTAALKELEKEAIA
jgi:N-methylhydantoinase B